METVYFEPNLGAVSLDLLKSGIGLHLKNESLLILS